MKRNKPLLVTAVVLACLFLARTGPAPAQNAFQVDYRLPEGEAFRTVRNATAVGTALAGGIAQPATLCSVLARRYHVKSFDPQIGYRIRKEFEFAKLEITMGTNTARLFWTPSLFEVDGTALWEMKAATEVTNLAPILMSAEIRMSPLGRISSAREEREIRYPYPERVRKHFRPAVRVVGLLGGDQEIFPAFAGRLLPAGKTWSRNLKRGPLPGGYSHADERFHYRLVGPDPPPEGPLRIEWEQKLEVANIPLLSVEDYLRPVRVADTSAPTPTPRPEIRQMVRAREGTRGKPGISRTVNVTMWFDTKNGRPIRSLFQGSQVISTLTQHFHSGMEDRTEMILDLHVSGETVYLYP